MRPPLMGIETEHAFSAWRVDGSDAEFNRNMLASALIDTVREHNAWLPDAASNGIFLGNGARLYVDAGDHPEYSTPECSSPREVICAAAAGDAILADAAAELGRRTGHVISLSRRNIDYRSGQTWGCHESYQHECPPETMWSQLLPHLVTRTIYTGAGGFEMRRGRPQFAISPRVAYLRQSFSDCSQRTRAIVHTKDESLCDEDVSRLHLVCGEALYSHRAAVLKLGTTALVVRMLDAGRPITGDLEFACPVSAMRAFSRDPTLGRRASIRGRGLCSALTVQRVLLERVEHALPESWMPDWAEDICKDWRATLDLLESDPDDTVGYLDWSTKQALFAQHRADRRGPGTEAALRDELFVIDARFTELGPDGLGRTLEEAGLLEPSIFTAAEIETARTVAPPGRAARRGQRIRELTHNAARYPCQWGRIADSETSDQIRFPLEDSEQGDWGKRTRRIRLMDSEQLEHMQRFRRLREEALQAMSPPPQPPPAPTSRETRPNADEPELPFEEPLLPF